MSTLLLIYKILKVLLILVSVALVVIVLMQEGKSGGLSAVAGAAGESYVSKNQSRTPEGRKRAITRILGAAFIVVALTMNILAKILAN
ncbi:MAG: preprotein translocase subunit SecG [Lachnospiraceae bacterium]|nr:preprotein translocase subunit SecG [Lachnospiraceae bacterium]